MTRTLIPQVLEPDYNYRYNPFFNASESPETAIARRTPYSAISLLDRMSRRKHYVEALSIGAKIVNTYLQGLPFEDHKELSKIRIEPETIINFLWEST